MQQKILILEVLLNKLRKKEDRIMEEIAFKEGDSKSIEDILKKEMELPLKHYEKDLASIRTGRATTALLDNIKVDCYGQLMALKEVATLSAPESRLLTIQPWDKSIIGEIEKAIMISDLGCKPVNDGNLIRIQIPQMSSDRREELVKLLGKKTEDCKVGIRNVRKEVHNEIRNAEKKKIISEDFAKKLSTIMQKITDLYMEKVDKLTEKKAHEVREI
ncbi:MAG: ribosome recycling factor [bacterium]